MQVTSSASRRGFLRSAGVALALPFLESSGHVYGKDSTKETTSPSRMVCLGVPFGFDPEVFIPKATGKKYELTPHLKNLSEVKDDFTILSGLSHPNTGAGGHKAEAVMLTGAAYPDYSHNLKNTISIDQQFASAFQGQTRFKSFVLSTYYGSLSYTSNGVAIPSMNRPSEIFKKLFLATTPQQAEEEIKRIDQGRSMLDLVRQQAFKLNKRISKNDRKRVEEYFTSVRDVEKQLQQARAWVKRPKPKPMGKAPQDISNNALQSKKLDLMMDMVYLALVTDSTRAITIKTFGMHHDLSHHGKQPKKLAECRAVEVQLLQVYAKLLKKLKSADQADGNLLDCTQVLMTSNLRDGNTHWTHDLPVLLAGGGFKHGQHLTFNQDYVTDLTQKPDPKNKKKNQKKAPPKMGINQMPLCNLYTTMLQKAGVEIDRFGSANGTFNDLL